MGIDSATESAARRDLGVKGGRALIERDGKVGNLVFFHLTAKGRSAAKEKDYKLWKSHASPTHSYVVRQCLKGLGRAGKVAILRREFAVNRRRPDALFRIDNRCIALQVCSCAGNYEREARALLALSDADGIDLAMLVASHRQHAREIRKALTGMISDVGWERLAVLDAAEALGATFDWGRVIGG